MARFRDAYDSFHELESVLLAAGDYVQASENLRPRVLETARTQCGEQRAQRRIRRTAVLVLLLAGFTASLSRPLESTGAGQDVVLTAAHRLHARAETYAGPPGDIGWGLVEAYSELRRRQSAMFRQEL